MLLPLSLPQIYKKTVILRCDFNIPKNSLSHIRLDTPIDTIKACINQSAKTVLISHRANNLSLCDIAPLLSKKLKVPVSFLPSFDIRTIQTTLDSLEHGGVVLLENVRHLKEEEAPYPHSPLEKLLTSIGDVYINEAISCSHRKHTSTYFVPKLFGLNAFKGIHLSQEEAMLSSFITYKGEKSLILGGAKLSTKLTLLENLLPSLSSVCIGGLLIGLFLKARNNSCGNITYDDKLLQVASRLYEKYGQTSLLLPIDYTIRNESGSIYQKKASDTIHDDESIVDIGEKTPDYFSNKIKTHHIFWNGPLGQYEMSYGQSGTLEMQKSLEQNSNSSVILGGGDVTESLSSKPLPKSWKAATGGGSTLYYISNGCLPCIDL